MLDPIVIAEAVDQFERLESREREVVLSAIERLGGWPQVSGVKALTGIGGKRFRVRAGGSRIIFQVLEGLPIVVRIGHRDEVYQFRRQHRQSPA